MTPFKSRTFHIIFIVIIALLFFFSTNPASAQNDRRNDLTSLVKQHAVWDPTQFVLEKVRVNRVVMIADFEHGVGLYYRVVIDAMNAWATAWEESGKGSPPRGLPSKMFLVLELDSIDVQSLNSYFRSGNAVETLKPDNFTGNCTIALLEFYYDLKILRERIDLYNRNLGSSVAIGMEIFGPEQVTDPNTWTFRGSQQFYASGRDEYSSSKIASLLDATPDAKALIYYGGAHLQRQRTPKLGNNQGWGYFMAHYLTEHYASAGGVYTCGQLPAATLPWVDDAFKSVGRTFAIDNSYLRGAAIGADASIIQVDGVIYHFSPPRDSPRIMVIPSENVVNFLLARLDSYTDTSKQLQSRNLSLCFDYLAIAAVRDYRPAESMGRSSIDSCIAAWRSWHQSIPLNIVEEISSLRYFARIIERMGSSSPDQSARYQRLLTELTGFKVWFPPDAPQQERVSAITMHLEKYRKPIVIENLIRLLWIGSGSEHSSAIAVLKKETGENFATAKAWSAWWEARKVK